MSEKQEFRDKMRPALVAQGLPPCTADEVSDAAYRAAAEAWASMFNVLDAVPDGRLQLIATALAVEFLRVKAAAANASLGEAGFHVSMPLEALADA